MLSVAFEKTKLPKQRTFGYLKNQPTLSLGEIKRLGENVGNQLQLQQDDGLPSGWKPLSLSAPILSAVAILSLLIAAAIEVLAQKSQQDGGLALSPTQDDIPEYAMIFYLYGPNVVAVLYSLIWSWIDLDTKRMQPWFELSKPEGATAENSLFLDYPYEFIAFVPWKAARRKHWPVFLSGLTMMLVFWAVTPLQSAVLGLGSVKVVKDVEIVTRGGLIDLPKQADLLDPRVLNNGYATAWLGQPFPSFTTPDYALHPFYIRRNPAPEVSSSNLTATTTKLTTELNCWPAKVSLNGPASKGDYDFLDGNGCNATVNLNRPPPWSMFYIGYYPSAYSDYALMGPSCPDTETSRHQFLAIWAATGGVTTKVHPSINYTALYCRPSYFKQDITISVSGDKFKPINSSVVSSTDKMPLTDKEFNSTAFEYLLANGMGEDFKQRDFPFNFVIEQHPRLAQTNLSRPVSNMVGFALAGQSHSTPEYSKPELLQNVFEKAHQHLFSLAVNRLQMNYTEFINQKAVSSFQLYGIVVSRPFAGALEGILSVIALGTLTLLWFCRKAPSNLPANPSSISRISEIFGDNPDVMEALGAGDCLTNARLQSAFSLYKFRLRCRYDSGLENRCIDMSPPQMSEIEKLSIESDNSFGPARPKALQWWSGCLFIACLISTIAGLIFLQQKIHEQNGLQRPTNNFEVLQLLENYVPTILSTLIEPFWVLLNRFLCMLQPFRELFDGKASQSNSVDATYTAIPPQLSIKRALKRSHYLLASVCSTALLANVLSVGLGALFNEAPVTLETSSILRPSIAHELDMNQVLDFESYLNQRLITQSTYQDHFYIVMANITLGTPLPPWTSDMYFFQPHNLLEEHRQHGGAKYNVSTIGFGVDVNCTVLDNEEVPINMPDAPNTFKNSTSCPNFIEIAKARMRQSTLDRGWGPSAIEYSNTLSGSLIPCDKTLVFGWGRTPQGQSMNSSISVSFAVCNPVMTAGLFEVMVDSDGYVESFSPKGTSKPSKSLAAVDMVIHANHLLNNPNIQWHNDTLSRSWMSYLVMESANSRGSLDPFQPTPNPSKLLSYVEPIYRKLFAVLLSQNQHLFQKAASTDSVSGKILTQETRIFMHQPAFIVCMTVLGLYVIVSSIYFTRREIPLPRMPSTIGSILAYTAPSRAAKIYGVPVPGLQLKTVSYGRFVGRDRKMHVGIEMDPYVVSVQSNLESGPFLNSLGKPRKRTSNHRLPK